MKTGGTGMTIEPWDLWWAEVKYEDHEGSKRRPVLIVSADEVYVLSYKITSHESRNQWGEYEIVQWQTAGLPKPSTVRLTQPYNLPRSSLKKKIGKLTPIDIETISLII